MMTANRLTRRLEDLLYFDGIFVFCYLTERKSSEGEFLNSNPSVMIVTHSDLEIPKIRAALHRNRSEILKFFGLEVEISFQFLVYYLTYLKFGEYVRSNENVYLSTTFDNIKTPERVNTSSTSALFFNLKVIGIIEGIALKSFDDVENDIREMAEAFNRLSRFIKLGKVSYGILKSRLQPRDSAPKLKVIEIDPGI